MTAADKMTDRKPNMDEARVSSPAGGSGVDPGIVWVESSAQPGGYSIKHASKPSTKVKGQVSRGPGAARLKIDEVGGEIDDPERGK